MKIIALTFFAAVILFFAAPSHTINSQTIDTATVKITSIQAGNQTLEKSEWGSISIKKDLPLSISFTTTFAVNKQIFYKVFVDGNLIYPNLLASSITLKDLNTGAHIIKIVPAVALGNEGIPLLIHFTVTDKPVSPVQPVESSTPDSFSFLNIEYIAGGIILIQFFVIVFLFVRRTQNPKISKKEKAADKTDVHDQIYQELASLKQSHTRLSEDLKEQQDINEHLQKQLKEVNDNMQDMEKANLHLFEQKKKLEESKAKLELLHEQKEEMFAIAIHDIKNPASAIRGYIELLNSYDLNATEQHDIMVSLVASSEDIVKRSQDMCTILAKAMPEPKLIFSSQNINEIIENVYGQNVSYSKVKKVQLVKKIGKDLPDLSIDADKIEEALDNLVNNAIKFAPQDSTVEIVSYLKEDTGKTVVVEVKDNGVGLTDDDMKRAFQKGATLSAKPTGLEKSSGLGLWIVKKIIDEHNGKIWLNSKVGEGTTFTFELPVETKE
ncbi:MAG: hypothetical protein CVV24_05135 [Ignavibacteriae bacterium HGW-Ignavibacteriae-3]|nr:MAG: hypothetical protein CVV24_05135 [Ignavibacteriae bacterium HGW-Ignavibacteriae-3]